MGRLSSAHSHEHACMLSIASRRQPPSSSVALVALRARHRTAHGDPSRRPRTRKRTCGHPRHGLRVQVRPYRTAGTTRCRDFFDSSQTTWQAPFEERRVGRHGSKLRTNPGVSKHHLPRNNARYALQTARHRRCRWPIILDETRVCHLAVLFIQFLSILILRASN